MALYFPKRCFIIVMVFSLLVVSCAPPAFAVQREPVVRSDAEYPATPEDVVEEYVRKDALGARAFGDMFGQIRDLLMWEDEGFDGFTIIAGYDIAPLSVESERACIEVTYRELGDTNLFAWVPNKRKTVITFVLKKDRGRWRISGPETTPHVLLDAAIDHLKRFIDLEHNEHAIETLKQLDKIRGTEE